MLHTESKEYCEKYETGLNWYLHQSKKIFYASDDIETTYPSRRKFSMWNAGIYYERFQLILLL